MYDSWPEPATLGTRSAGTSGIEFSMLVLIVRGVLPLSPKMSITVVCVRSTLDFTVCVWARPGRSFTR